MKGLERLDVKTAGNGMNAISKMARQMAKQAGYGLGKCDRRHGYPLDFLDEKVEMVAPVEHDVSRKGNRAVDKFEKKTEGDRSDWYVAGRTEVARNMALTGYPEEKIHYVEGKVLWTCRILVDARE